MATAKTEVVNIDKAWREERWQQFAARYQVKKYDLGKRHMRKVLLSCGGSPEQVRKLLGDGDYIFDGPIKIGSGPFDHPEIWGRDRAPLVIVGHPYGIIGEDLDLLTQVKALGLKVQIDTFSHYGHGTCRVIMAHPDLWKPPA